MFIVQYQCIVVVFGDIGYDCQVQFVVGYVFVQVYVMVECVCQIVFGQVVVIVVYVDVYVVVDVCYGYLYLMCGLFVGVVEQVVEYFFQIFVCVGEQFLCVWIVVEGYFVFDVYVLYQFVQVGQYWCYWCLLLVVCIDVGGQVVFDVGLYLCGFVVQGLLLVVVFVFGFGGEYG